MQLTESECNLFYNLYHPLLLFVNQQRHVIADVFTVEGLRKKTSEQLKTLRTILFQQSSLLDQFLITNPFHFLPHELEIINSWKKWLVGRFFIFRETNYYDKEARSSFGKDATWYYRLSDSGDGVQIPPKSYFPTEWDRLIADLSVMKPT